MENNGRTRLLDYNPQYGSLNTGSLHPDNPQVRYHNPHQVITYCTWGLLVIVCIALLLPAVWIFIHHAIMRHWFFLTWAGENVIAPSRVQGFNVSETLTVH
ncbi:uncharacterized protein LOC124359202 [Homalodisca vitripennis]|uniref:uncharacterized protein LOC124359202 n=1 Tax=Homalodisca vitripennis TaxID=197043 RepID=UPI001EEC530F|nr:uncharacterized protein LOC124359202 [Homalodisca vitripennis]